MDIIEKHPYVLYAGEEYSEDGGISCYIVSNLEADVQEMVTTSFPQAFAYMVEAHKAWKAMEIERDKGNRIQVVTKPEGTH